MGKIRKVSAPKKPAPSDASGMAVASWTQQIGARLAAIREAQHRNQTGVAKEAGISKDALSVMENGKRGFQIDRLIKVLLVLNVDPWTFFGGSPKHKPTRPIQLEILHDKLDDISTSEEFKLVEDVILTYHERWRRSR